jgi:hypothetical protein
MVRRAPSHWKRTQVYADEELQIDLDTSWVGDNEGVPQVRVRWKWSQQRSLRMTPGVSYQSRIEILEMDCSGWRIHTASLALFDSAGEEIEFDRTVPSTRWDEIEPDSLADIIAGPACDLIKSKVRQ